MQQPRSWRAMWEREAERLRETTGEDLATWNARVLADAPGDEAGLRRWLSERGIDGYRQSLLVMERFGYPDFLAASDEELIDAQYADRPHLRPILDHLLTVVASSHPEVEVVGRKTYVPLHTPRRQFAVVKPTTRSRVDLGLRLDGHPLDGRLEVAKGLANETIDRKIALTSVDEVDDEVVGWLDLAWDVNR